MFSVLPASQRVMRRIWPAVAAWECPSSGTRYKGWAVRSPWKRSRARARVVIELPLTLAIVDALIVRVREQRFAVPLPVVREVLQLTAAAITRFEHNEIMAYRNAVLPLLRLADFFNLNGAASRTLRRRP